jgi:hypothetical protein
MHESPAAGAEAKVSEFSMKRRLRETFIQRLV